MLARLLLSFINHCHSRLLLLKKQAVYDAVIIVFNYAISLMLLVSD